MLKYLFNDDGLYHYLARNSVRLMKVNNVKDVGFQVLAHLVERGTVEARTRKSVVDILFDERVIGGRDLLLERKHLALDGAFLGLKVVAHTRIEHGAYDACRGL